MDMSFGDDFYSDPANFFNALGRPVPKMPSAAEVRSTARKKAAAIFANYELLNQILLRHESTIRKRWTKKGRQQRLKILMKAWPGMATQHRPDYEVFKRAKSQPLQRAPKQVKDSFMWPYINQEDLSQTQPLLLLLNARARNHPSSFAAADLEAMHLGIVTEAIERIFLNEYTMILHGVTVAKEYGKLLAWDDHPDAFDWMHTQKQFNPSDGLIVLEAQDRLMEFLVDCCRDVLHDISHDQLISEAYAIQPEPPLQLGDEARGFESLASMAAEAPYRAPAQLDLGRIESLLSAKTRAAEDHLWALREDPAYFRQYVLDAREHRLEMIKDELNNTHPTLIPGREGLFRARVVGEILFEAYLELEFYSELHHQAQNLVFLQKKYEAAISPLKDLPEEYLNALLTFHHFLNQAVKGPLDQLKVAVPASPPMRKFFVRRPPEDASSSKMAITSSGLKKTTLESQLLYLLQTLWENDHNLFLLRLSCAVDELERLLLTEPTTGDLISSNVARLIGNLSIVSQVIHQLEIYQPWARNFEDAFLGVKAEIQQEFATKSEPWGQIMAALRDTKLAAVARLAEPLLRNFNYPIDKRRTKENVEKLRQAERDLDLFWAEVDRVMRPASSKLQDTAVQKLFTQASSSLQRTPEWVDQPTPLNVAATAHVEQPLSPLYFDLWNGRAEDQTKSSSAHTTPARAKIKTRGTADRQTESSHSAEPTHGEEVETPKPCIKVDSRAFKVFRTLFFNSDITSTPGEVPWNDFVHALTSVGFAAQKLYGSVWQFSPSGLDVEASIQFHEPHPRGKIPFMVARRHGRRLARNYGWAGDMFVLNK
ncbi:hypothetical protein BBK36DRAFT_1159666 [Trichoderma citrinoviride]|uniref:Uncharacterized protein n=1 Tax=Trichoderma citrinoviride TaxID=58853 RepID=A0A2T4B860_9HYPO|nr:hypothetical protein BBK36DRAFT_1159666 [Trichoderma citrinoviride]PTB65517.1 hypothetical protein BBK36DRAFT_1159666 [Trichoderma citrinoviride]